MAKDAKKAKPAKPVKRKKINVKLVVLASILAVCLIVVALGFILPGSKDTVAKAGIQSEFYADDYKAYLEEVGYEPDKSEMAKSEANVNVTEDYITYVYEEVEEAEAETDLAEEPVEEATGEVVEVVLTKDKEVRVNKGKDDTIARVEEDGLVLGEDGHVEWTFNVEEDGFYNLSVLYKSIKGTTSNPQRAMLIDGKELFSGMAQIEFKRTWNNGEIISKGGNEIRPEAVEEFVDTQVWISDITAKTLSPYVFYLTSGEHTIAFESNGEEVLVKEISFKAAPAVVPYAEYLKANQAGQYAGENIILQAERTGEGVVKITKSSNSINVATDFASSYSVPYHHWNQLLNVMGGSSWAGAGDSITWTFEVPEDGYYQIAPRARQNTNRGVKSFRRIKVNGQVPFEEASKIGFDYSTSFENYVLADSQGNPFLFYLNKGENTLTMEVVLGDFANSYAQINNSVQVLNRVYREVVQITGTVPDTYIDYEIAKKVAGFEETMAQQAGLLNAVVQELVAITGEKGSSTIQIEKIALQCAQFAEEPDDVVDEISDFKSNISALGTWMLNIASMPLEIDSFTLSKPNATLKCAEPNAIVAAGNETIRFFATFVVDDTQIASDEKVTSDAVKVWIASGRDQAQIIRNLIDSDYSPNAGKSVNLQLIPGGVLLPATLAGNGPDVSLSNAQASVVDFAVRGALTDLSQFDGFEDVKSRFYDSAIDTASYNGGVYGLPETQSFSVLFYREDVLDEYGIEVPQTWDDVEEVINVLHGEGLDFYIPTSAIYSTLVFQYGGDLYHGAAGTVDANGYKFADDGSDYGIESALRDEPAMQAFKRLTEFFTTYALPVSADFSNRFRTGEIPIGVADYTLFNTLEIFAPEIKGLWNFAPLPGYRDPVTGEVNNVVISGSSHTIMMDASKNKEDAWQFIDWWLSEDTQADYGITIESILGSGARYATANVKVLDSLPWAKDQADVIKEQFENTKGVPDVPGYYMTGREIDYAFKGVVTDGQNPREALYLNVKEINDELTNKREEFGLTRYNEEGEVVND